MKKCAVTLLLIMGLFLFFGFTALAETDDSWKEKPVITSVYESGNGQVIIEWTGSADLYEIYLDGNKKPTITTPLDNAELSLKAGRHRFSVTPVHYQPRDVDTNVSFSFDGKIIGGGGSLDLGALGIDPKDLLRGTSSDTFSFNYTVSPILSASPEIKDAATDSKDRVVLLFEDKYDSDIYIVSLMSGKDVNYVEYDLAAAEAAALVTKNNTSVSLILDRDYLKKQGCMLPQLGEEMSFKVMLYKHPINQVDREKVLSFTLESKESKAFGYTPVAAWKTAPVITYASQTADGQVTLRWEHDGAGSGCQYEVLMLDKKLVVKKTETVLGTTSKNEFVVKDLMNGKFSFAVRPVSSTQQGESSSASVVEVKNDWVLAPSLACTAISGDRIRLNWTAAKGVESYHITVYSGSGSLLRYVNLDFNKYREFDVQAKDGDMEYIFTYGKDVVSENGVKLKFEIYGVKHAANGEEQKSAVSSQIITA